MKAMGMLGMVALFAALAIMAYYFTTPAAFYSGSVCPGTVGQDGASCSPIGLGYESNAGGGNFVLARNEHDAVDTSAFTSGKDITCVGIYTSLLDNNMRPLTYPSITCPGVASVNGNQLWCAIGSARGNSPPMCAVGTMLDQHTIQYANLEVRWSFSGGGKAPPIIGQCLDTIRQCGGPCPPCEPSPIGPTPPSTVFSMIADFFSGIIGWFRGVLGLAQEAGFTDLGGGACGSI